ncbi:MAG: hypothetical protein ACM3PY_04000 [Omnitrophica WOR_2 bacterium]
MSALFSDTRPEAENILIELLKKTPPWRKIEMVGQMNMAVKTVMISGLKDRFPQDPPEVIQRRLADLILGPEMAAKVYGVIEENKNAR